MRLLAPLPLADSRGSTPGGSPEPDDLGGSLLARPAVTQSTALAGLLRGGRLAVAPRRFPAICPPPAAASAPPPASAHFPGPAVRLTAGYFPPLEDLTPGGALVVGVFGPAAGSEHGRGPAPPEAVIAAARSALGHVFPPVPTLPEDAVMSDPGPSGREAAPKAACRADAVAGRPSAARQRRAGFQTAVRGAADLVCRGALPHAAVLPPRGSAFRGGLIFISGAAAGRESDGDDGPPPPVAVFTRSTLALRRRLIADARPPPGAADPSPLFVVRAPMATPAERLALVADPRAARALHREALRVGDDEAGAGGEAAADPAGENRPPSESPGRSPTTRLTPTGKSPRPAEDRHSGLVTALGAGGVVVADAPPDCPRAATAAALNYDRSGGAPLGRLSDGARGGRHGGVFSLGDPRTCLVVVGEQAVRAAAAAAACPSLLLWGDGGEWTRERGHGGAGGGAPWGRGDVPRVVAPGPFPGSLPGLAPSFGAAADLGPYGSAAAASAPGLYGGVERVTDGEGNCNSGTWLVRPPLGHCLGPGALGRAAAALADRREWAAWRAAWAGGRGDATAVGVERADESEAERMATAWAVSRGPADAEAAADAADTVASLLRGAWAGSPTGAWGGGVVAQALDAARWGEGRLDGHGVSSRPILWAGGLGDGGAWLDACPDGT